jgi:hypothetical protein
VKWWCTWHILGRRGLHTGVWWRNLQKRDHLEDLGIDGRIILKWILNRLVKLRLDEMAVDRDERWAVMSVVMNLWIP